MAIVTKPNTFTSGTTIIAAQVNSNFDTLYNDYNGNITNANISGSANISDTKLATITTAGKVNISALTVASQAQGDIIYADTGSTWTRLGAGTNGQFLQTQGAGANPQWADISQDGFVVQRVYTSSGAVATGNTSFPNDDTIPQITEGTEFITRAITPLSTTNRLLIQVVAYLADNTETVIGGALFQDATAAALAAGQISTIADRMSMLVINHEMAAGTVSSTTFRFRAGSDSGTTTFNGVAGSRKLGGVVSSSITITEVQAS